jgi:hypothetical protein
MANALNQNLEKYDVFQVHASKLQVIQEKKDYRDIKEGETIRSDLQVQGSKIFSDVAWKPKKNLKAGETEITGHGVYCQILQDNLKATILLQASTGKTPSPLHAEALGLLLTTKIAQLLKVNQITFITYNLQLERAAASSPSEEHVP